MFCTVWVCSTELFFAAWWLIWQSVIYWLGHWWLMCLLLTLSWDSKCCVCMLNCESDICMWLFWSLLFGPAATHQGWGMWLFNFYFFSMLPSVWMWGIYSETSIHYYNIPLNHSSTRLCMINFFTCSSCTILFPPWSQVSGICVVCHRQLIRLVRVLWSLKSLGKMISALKVYGKWIIQLRSVKVCQFWLLSVLTSSVKLRSARDFLTVFLAAWLHALAD